MCCGFVNPVAFERFFSVLLMQILNQCLQICCNRYGLEFAGFVCDFLTIELRDLSSLAYLESYRRFPFVVSLIMSTASLVKRVLIVPEGTHGFDSALTCWCEGEVRSSVSVFIIYLLWFLACLIL